MLQIFINYLTIFIIPAIFGVLSRLVFMKRQKGYIVTVFLLCVSAALVTYALVRPNNGNEGPGLMAVSSLIAAVTCTACGAIIRFVRRKNNSN